MRLWYPAPASEWLRALPLGNGRLGAMVHGGVENEEWQLNEDTIWAAGPYDHANPDGLAALPEIRRRVFAGEWAAAQDLYNAEFMGIPTGQVPYQTIGSLRLTFPGGSDTSEYYRELDLTTAIATTRYVRDGVTFTREVFASAPDQLIVARLHADEPGSVSFTATLDSPLSRTGLSSPDPLSAALDGTSEGAGGIAGQVNFRTVVTARATGGSVSSSGGTVTVSGADEVLLLVSTGTNRVGFRDLSGDQNARAAAPIAEVDGVSYDELRSRHVADYQGLFGRTTLDLGTSGAAELPTDERVAAFGGGNDPQLVTLFYQFGRYLLISASRPGTQVANLQGIWNDLLAPPWSSKYTININIEMNYWPAGQTNLLECMEPVFDMLSDLSVTGADTARLQYGAGGWVTHHNTDGWRGTAPVDAAFYGAWQTGGAWMALHIWEHYRFSGDLEGLRARYPVLKGAAQFFVDALVEDPSTGHMVTNPSNSPENGHHQDVSICAGPTMDNQIVRDLFSAVAEASELLGTDAGFRDQVLALRDRLAPTEVGGQGQIQEWREDWDAGAPDFRHRHISHLYGLHPSNQITPRATPDLAEAARVTLEQRGDAGTGWSLAWKINFWARLEDGARSYKLLSDQLTTERTAPNLFCLHPPFQIDGNFGATSGITEWLLQSHAGEVHLLPALPGDLPAGSVTGLLARGGFETSITWASGALTEATLRSANGAPVRLRTRVPVNVTSGDQTVPVERPEETVVTFATQAGATYRIAPR
nr:glycoside hydrolase family 95 protein [Streptomyces sp. SBT349]